MVNAESVTKETFRAELERLVSNFAANEDELTAQGYTEMQARTQFITPFFRALGWDVENRAGKPYREMDVLEERGPGEGRPDYTFRIGGSAKFFVEAKAPHEDLENERHVLQAKRYAWSTKEVFAVVLTDFREFRFYDASLEPNPDHPHRGQLLDLTYRQYLDNFDKLWELSRQRVAAGSIEALLPRDKRALRHRKHVDDKFLEDMTRWRTELAKGVHKRNPDLGAHALTDIVQRLLDRFIFIRVAEDRRIVEKNTLLDRALDWEAMGGRKPLLPMVNDLFHQINDDFNGDIFKPHRCEEIKLTDQALHRMIKELYPPKSPYRFDVIPVDIFGAVYERYLGRIIHVRGKDVNVEDKQGVRKAGGVYYTPKYIVDYIVKNTVGRVIEDKTPKQIEKIKILDPACGSGSFLLGAFQYLIDYHVSYYEKHPRQARVHPLCPDLVKSNGVPRLSIWRKAKILHNNLFGVDLDPQAVEITMINLYLKALEQERDLPRKQHLLPELGRNIRCGNSLIAPDIANEQELSEEGLKRLNPFDWRSQIDGFGDLLEAGGFDAVIGNPPYGADFDAQAKSHLKKHFSSVADYESAQYFILRAAAWLRQLGLIVPNTTFLNVLAKHFRSSILDSYRIEEIVDLSEVQVFQDAAVRTSLVFAKKVHSDAARRKGSFIVCEGSPQPGTPNILIRSINTFTRRRLFERDRNWFRITLPKEMVAIIEKVESRAVPLKQFTRVSQGLIPYDKYRGHSQATIKKRIWHAHRRKTKSYRRELRGGDVSRYLVNWNGEQWIRYGPWLAAPRKPEFFTKPRLLFREITNPGEGDLNVAYTEEEFYNTPVIINVIGQQSPYDLRFFLAITNSKLIGFYHHHSSPKSRKGMFPKILVVDVRNLPIRPLDLTNSYEKDSHDGLVNLANQMLSLKRRLCRGRLARDLTALQHQIDTVDQKIDALVYKIYGITAAECKLIETASGAPRSG